MAFLRLNILFVLFLNAVFLAACSVRSINKDGPPPGYVDVSNIPNAVPKYEPRSRYGNPNSYVVMGKRYYVLKSAKGYNQRGIASWYGRKFNGHLTSTRERYDMLAMTAASPVLPIPSYARVTNLSNGRSIIVKVNDRGPFAPNRILDLSYAAAKKLGYMRKGTALVQVTAITPGDPVAALPVIATGEPHLYLQVGAFSQYENAEQLKQRLSTYTEKPIQITETKSHFKTIYRVRIGPLIGVGESDKLFSRLQQHGLHTAITVIA